MDKMEVELKKGGPEVDRRDLTKKGTYFISVFCGVPKEGWGFMMNAT